MNTELVEARLAAAGRRLVVLDDGAVDHDLVRNYGGGPDIVLRPLVRPPLSGSSRRHGGGGGAAWGTSAHGWPPRNRRALRGPRARPGWRAATGSRAWP